MKHRMIAVAAVLSTVLVGGCGSVSLDKQSQDLPKNDISIQSIRQETKADNVFAKEQSGLDDGVYRTYSFGVFLQERAVLKLQSALLLQVMEQPVKTMIYLDGSLYKTVDFSKEDKEIRLEESGNYWIIVIDAENNYKDITDKIEYFMEGGDSGLLYLEQFFVNDK